MAPPITCLVTIHGIGFQQPPAAGVAGYADDLHTGLTAYLDASMLADDPNREQSRPGVAGPVPVYVQSNWPPGSGATEPGLSRLGRWSDSPDGIDISAAPLVNADQPIAHVALVYSHLEGRGPEVGPLAEITHSAVISLGQYASVAGIGRMLFSDAVSALQQPAAAAAFKLPTSLSLRSDLTSLLVHPAAAQLLGNTAAQPVPTDSLPQGALATLRQLENDVAAYVTRNDLRERVRSFVREALLRLAARADVAGIVVNSHSQGTVVAFDALRDLPRSVRPKMRAFITAGSPLRKYVSLFEWGDEAGCIYDLGPWSNYWDTQDPVADPLNSPPDWRPGTDPQRPPGARGRFQAVDPDAGTVLDVHIDDHQVDNLTHSSGGGLQAHNYWDNTSEFVSPLADLLRGLTPA